MFECSGSQVFEVSYVYVVWSCGVVVSLLFECCLCLCYCDVYVCTVQFFDPSICLSVCGACLVCDVVCELFVEEMCFLFVCDGCFVVECDSTVWVVSEFGVVETCDGVP